MPSWSPQEWSVIIYALFGGAASFYAAYHAKQAQKSCETTQVASDTHHQLVSQSLGVLTTGTEAIRNQSNGNTDRLLNQIRDLTRELTQARAEVSALRTEVSGLRTERKSGGRWTDPRPAPLPGVGG